uniref:multicopper oxidase domain-containing protein n=1 Tax=Tepidiforma sp. TaxID=2682230 RepID=UPI002ADD4769
MNAPFEPFPAPAQRLDRRRFLKRAGVVGAAIPVAGALISSACYEDPTGQKAEPTGVGSGNVKPGPTPASGGENASQQRWQKIDADHQKGVLDFLRNQKAPLTKGRGNVPLEPRIENGVKVWDLTIDEVDWEVVPGQVEKARGYNKMIPGPILRGKVGDRVRINVTNNLTESTAVHW